MAAVLACALSAVTRADDAPAIKITSPLGRTGLPGTIRIVARLDGAVPLDDAAEATGAGLRTLRAMLASRRGVRWPVARRRLAGKES